MCVSALAPEPQFGNECRRNGLTTLASLRSFRCFTQLDLDGNRCDMRIVPPGERELDRRHAGAGFVGDPHGAREGGASSATWGR